MTQLQVGDLIYASVDHVERFTIPEDGLLLKLPEDVDPADAALFGISGVAMHCCRRIDPRIGERVLIVGQGCIGMFAAQIAHAMGARVTVCDIEESRLEQIRQLGVAEQVFNTSGDGWKAQIQDGAFDAVMDFAGVPDMVTPMIHACKTRGRLLLVADGLMSIIPLTRDNLRRLAFCSAATSLAMIWKTSADFCAKVLSRLPR